MCAPARRRAPPRRLTCGGGHCEPEKQPQPQLHEPQPGAGAPGARTDACGCRRGLRPARWASPSSCGGSGRRLAAASWLRPGLGFGGHRLRSALPIPAQGWPAVGSGFSGSSTTPPRLPAPRRGWSCRAGPLNPGRTGGRLAGAGGSAEARGAPSAARGGGGAPPGAVGWGVGWSGGRDSCRRPRAHTHTHAHTHICTRAHIRARAHSPHTPSRCSAAADLQPPPPAKWKIKGSAQSLRPLISGARGKPPFSVLT